MGAEEGGHGEWCGNGDVCERRARRRRVGRVRGRRARGGEVSVVMRTWREREEREVTETTRGRSESGDEKWGGGRAAG